MKKIQFLFLCSFLCITSCKSNDKSTWTYEFIGGKTQEFEIVLNKDTTIVCKGGTKLHISKNTFIGATSNFKIQVKEALTKADMMSFGLSTNADDNVLLESTGMIQLKPIGNLNVKINVDAPIRVEMPTRYINEKTRLYTEGVQNGASFTWKEANKLNNDAILGKIELGGKLFDVNCANCHSKKLDEKLTGPPLAHIQKIRPLNWLIDFTRNPFKTIADESKNLKDSTTTTYAVCIWNEYKPTLMNAFPKLTDTEISSIYTFIADESEKKNYKPTENHCISQEVLKAQVIENKVEETIENTTLDIESAFTPHFDSNQITYNSFSIKNFDWHNCDNPVENCSEIEFAVDYDKPKIQGVDIFIVFKNRKILYHWYGMPMVQIPQEEATVFAFGKTESGVQFYQNDVKIGKINKFHLDFKPKSMEEIQRIISKL